MSLSIKTLSGKLTLMLKEDLKIKEELIWIVFS